MSRVFHFPASVLREVLAYDAETGALTWLTRSPATFPNHHKIPATQLAATFNTQRAGKPAFCSVGARGYLVGGLLGHTLLAHRVIWAWVHGEWPEDQIDHINGNRVDNRLCNLRSVSRAMNCRNMKMFASNKTGFIGVDFIEKTGRFRARIRVDGGKCRHIGCFATAEDAASAYRIEARLLGYHENHGRAA